jgi:hypothetical protein
VQASSTYEPIVKVACRFPGEVNDPMRSGDERLPV